MKSKQKEKTENNFSESIKKLVEAGISIASIADDAVRSTSKSKVFKTVINRASKSKEDVLNKISKEAKKSLGRFDFVNEATKFIKDHRFKFSVEVEKKSKTKRKKKP